MKPTPKKKLTKAVDTAKPLWFSAGMKVEPDRLRLLKGKYLSEISGKERDLALLREKVKLIDELERDAEKLDKSTAGVGLKYSSGTQSLIQSALDTVRSIGIDGVTAPKVAKYLEENGYQPNGKHFTITVGSCLRRLAARGDIVSERQGGKRVFMPKPYMISGGAAEEPGKKPLSAFH